MTDERKDIRWNEKQPGRRSDAERLLAGILAGLAMNFGLHLMGAPVVVAYIVGSAVAMVVAFKT